MNSDHCTRDPKQVQAAKAWSFFSVLASMGQFVAFAARAVTTRKPRKYSAAYKAVAPARWPYANNEPVRKPAAERPEHIAAVALMREARRLKRMAKAEDALSEKRRRQAGQLQRHAQAIAGQLRRHARAIARRTKAMPLCPPHAVVPAPHFLRSPC